MKRNIWVVGGYGQIGEGLKEHAWIDEVNYISRDELDILNLETPFKFQCETIVDLVPSPKITTTKISEEDYTLKYTLPHIEFMKKALSDGVKNYIFTSSGGSVYGHVSAGSKIDESFPLHPVSNYGKSKLLIERALIEQSEKYHARFVILRPGNSYNENPNSKRQAGLIGALIDCFVNNKEFNLYGGLDISKDYISNKDIAEAIIKSSKTSVSGVFNLGTGVAHSIKSILDLFEEKFQKTISINHKDALVEDVSWNCLDGTHTKKVLRFEAKDKLSFWLDSVVEELNTGVKIERS